jgi:hypothetical protein
LDGEENVLLTISIKSSTSSDAKGAILSVLEYQGGLMNGEVVERSAFGSSLRVLLLNRKAHLILSFQLRISSCKAALSGGSRGVGVKLGPLDRREMTPVETLTLLRRRGLKLSVEKGTMLIGEDLRIEWPLVEACELGQGGQGGQVGGCGDGGVGGEREGGGGIVTVGKDISTFVSLDLLDLRTLVVTAAVF